MDHFPIKSYSSSAGTGGKKNFLMKTWERCRSVQGSLKEKSTSLSKSKSWHAGHVLPREKKAAAPDDRKRAPGGCFSVYVGPEKQRFAVKAKYANHPLFMMLLEDAEMEYGYNSEGPITLPCEVDLFYKVLAEMENGAAGYKVPEEGSNHPHGCGFAYGSCSPFNPSRRLCGHSDQTAKGYGSYEHLTPSRLIQMN